jgi:hypothetical protein
MKASLVGAGAIVLIVVSACSGRTKPSPGLGSVTALRERAVRLGCELVDGDYFGADAFSCIKRLASCGCTLLVKADTTDEAKPSLNLIRVDLVGCRAGEGSDELAQLLDPFITENAASFHDFITTPQVARTQAQEARFAVLKSARHGALNVRAMFGAQPSANVGAARRTVWIDSVAAEAPNELVPDSAIDARCHLALEAAELSSGYCDTAAQGVAPCELDAATRGRYRERVAEVVLKARSAWREAIRTLLRERKLQPSLGGNPEQLAHALVGVLPAPAEPGLSPGSIKAGINGLQLAVEAASDWQERLMWNLESLFDADLAALVLSLPAPEEISAPVMAERIRHRVEQLSTQRSR